MRIPVAARKATTQKRKSNAGIIGQQVYLSYARCNAKGAAPFNLLPGRGRAGAAQSRFTANSGIAMNDPVLGRFVDRGDERRDIGSLSAGAPGTSAEGANTTQHLSVVESAALSLSGAFGSGFGIS